MLVALAIMAGVMALAVPMLPRHASGIELEAAARQITSGLRDARAAAIQSGRPAVFRLDVATGAFGHDRARKLPRLEGLALTLLTTERLAGVDVGGIAF